MPREIKFRAWDKEQTRAFTKMLYQTDDIYSFFQELQNAKAEYGCDWELMQFTGLYDKDERKIYEGDLVKVPDYTTLNGRTILHEATEVTFCEGAFYLGFGYSDDLSSNACEVEVVGNIWENPELLSV